MGDAVGWGFVVRGSKPCHIQAVDPGGPAAAVGMKVMPNVQRTDVHYIISPVIYGKQHIDFDPQSTHVYSVEPIRIYTLIRGGWMICLKETNMEKNNLLAVKEQRTY